MKLKTSAFGLKLNMQKTWFEFSKTETKFYNKDSNTAMPASAVRWLEELPREFISVGSIPAKTTI